MNSKKSSNTLTLPPRGPALKSVFSKMKKDGVFDNIKHLKTYHAVEELAAAIFSEDPVSIVGGPTGSGKTIGFVALSASILEIAHCPGIEVVYGSIPLRKGVMNAFNYSQESVLSSASQRKNVGWSCGGETKYRNEQVRICTTGHVFNRLAKLLTSKGRDREQLNKLCIVVDEAHTPTSENYLLIALCMYIQEEGYTLKMVVMSATLDSAPLLDEFENVQARVELEGHLYNTETVHLHRTPSDREVCDVAIKQIRDYANRSLNILCFVAGEADIQKITKAFANDTQTMDVCALISSMPKEEMDQAFEPPPSGKVKVIVSTNIAESSVTIAGIDVVIDTGFEIGSSKSTSGRGTVYEKRRISRASAKQRAGRVGRVKPGINVRLWTRDFEDHDMQKHSKSEFYAMDPEVQVLRLISLGLDSRRITRLTISRHRTVMTRLSQLGLVERTSDADQARDNNGMLWKVTTLGTRVLQYNTTLDISVSLAHLDAVASDTEKIVGTSVLALIEGCQGYLPFWTHRDQRDEINKHGYSDYDFGDFLGQDDVESLFLLLFGEAGLLQHRCRIMTNDKASSTQNGKKGGSAKMSKTLSFASATQWRDIGKIRTDWAKTKSMNSKHIKNSMRIFEQCISVMLNRRFSQAWLQCYTLVDQRIFDPNEYAYIESALQAVRLQFAKTFEGECFKPTMCYTGRTYEAGFKDVKRNDHFFDKRRSFNKLMRKSEAMLPRVLPFNISITQKGKRFISGIMLDPRSEASITTQREQARESEQVGAWERDQFSGSIYAGAPRIVISNRYIGMGGSEEVSPAMQRQLDKMMAFMEEEGYSRSEQVGYSRNLLSRPVRAAPVQKRGKPKTPVIFAESTGDGGATVSGETRLFYALEKSQFKYLGGWSQ